jgi:hypothetical protein
MDHSICNVPSHENGRSFPKDTFADSAAEQAGRVSAVHYTSKRAQSCDIWR